MLKFYRKHIKSIIWLIILSFVIWGAGTLSVSKDSASSFVGSVRGEKIYQKEFLTIFRYYDLLSRSQAKEEEIAQNAEPAKKASTPEPLTFDELRALTWQTIILSREAKREGITISDEEVRSEIKKLFLINGEFNQALYQKWTHQNFQGRKRDFEEVIRKHLATQKMREKVLGGVPESERKDRWTEWIRPVLSRAQIKDSETQSKNA